MRRPDHDNAVVGVGVRAATHAQPALLHLLQRAAYGRVHRHKHGLGKDQRVGVPGSGLYASLLRAGRHIISITPLSHNHQIDSGHLDGRL